MRDLIADLRFSARLLAKQRGVSLTVALTLGLCIGANVSIFNLLNAFSQRPPVAHAERLTGVFTKSPSLGPYGRTSYLDYLDYRAHNRVFSDLAAYTSFGASARVGERTEWVWGALVTNGYFPTLGVAPRLGRAFSSDEQLAGGSRVAVISDAIWHGLFAADPGVLGKPIALNGSEFTVIGVAPERFKGTTALFHPGLYLPLRQAAAVSSPDMLEDRTLRVLSVFGRLLPGVGLAEAQVDLATLGRQLDLAYPQPEKTREVRVEALTLMPPTARDWYLPTIRLLMVAVAILWLIGATNIANLLLVRASDRRAEFGLRTALGGSRLRLIRTLVADSLLLALPAALLGLLFTLVTRHAIGSYFAPATAGALGDAPELAPDHRVFLFTLLVAVLTALIVSVLPVLQLGAADPATSLRAGGRDAPARLGRSIWESGLVVTQVALSAVLLAAALLLARSFHNIRDTDPGFQVNDVILAAIDLQGANVAPAEGERLYRRVVDKVAALPGIAGASMVEVPPLSGFARSEPIHVEGREHEEPDLDSNVVGPDYFRILKIPLLRGRTFTDQDSQANSRVVVVNQSMVTRYWPQGDPIGRRIRLSNPEMADNDGWYRVVGEVKDTRFLSLGEEPQPEFYTTFHQRFRPRMTLLARAELNPRSLLPRLRREIGAVDPRIGIIYITTLPTYLNSSIWEPRLRAEVMRVFAVLTLGLAMVGVFAIINHRVNRRRREIGIRFALGANRSDVIAMVVREGILLALAGVALGGIASTWTQRLLASFLYGVKPGEPAILFAACLLLILIAALASYLPARRASHVDPLTIIRTDI